MLNLVQETAGGKLDSLLEERQSLNEHLVVVVALGNHKIEVGNVCLLFRQG